jgi:hypothetical protein
MWNTLGNGSARTTHQLAAAVGASLPELHGAGGAEGALVAADEREITVLERRVAALALGPHLEAHV